MSGSPDRAPWGSQIPGGQKAPRVLHVVETFDRGAVENWLLRMLQHAASRQAGLDWTFYCTLGRPGGLDEAVRAAGGAIIQSPEPMGRTVPFLKALRAEIRRGGYEVLHAHHDLISGAYLAASSGLSVDRRLVHVHNADENLPTPNRLKAALLRMPLRGLALGADRVVGISNHTLDTFLHGRARRPGRDRVHYYGVDPSPFLPGRRIARAQFRSELGLPPDALIMLFGGRVTPEKNPVMVIDVLAELRRYEPRAVAVFAGAGSLEDEVRAQAERLGVADHVRMLGWRTDLPAIMSAADLFILPRPERPMEGFGLAVVEAQLAGLRMLISKGVPDDPLLPTAQYRRLGLDEGAAAWAKAGAELLARPAPSVEAAHEALAASPMDMDFALRDLMALHA